MSGKSNEEKVEKIREGLISSASKGVAATSVDGLSVSFQNNADRKVALDEAKKAAVKNFPMTFCKWR